jgi:hypothetical protein
LSAPRGLPQEPVRFASSVAFKPSARFKVPFAHLAGSLRLPKEPVQFAPISCETGWLPQASRRTLSVAMSVASGPSAHIEVRSRSPPPAPVQTEHRAENLESTARVCDPAFPTCLSFALPPQRLCIQKDLRSRVMPSLALPPPPVETPLVKTFVPTERVKPKMS